MNNPLKSAPKRSMSNLPLYIIGVIIMVLIYLSFNVPTTVSNDVALSEILNDIKNSKVESIEVDGTTVNVKLKDGQEVKSRVEERSSFLETLKNSGIDPTSVKINIKDTTTGA